MALFEESYFFSILFSLKIIRLVPYAIRPIPIRKNIIAMVAHKIGGIVVNSTDNLLISKFVGLIYVGIYDNYYIIINALNLILLQIFEILSRIR